MASSLKFDLDAIKAMRTSIQTSSEELVQYKADILREFEDLTKEWKTPAGDAFLEKVNFDWIDEVDKYVTILEAVDKLLGEAETQYSKVEAEIELIKFG